MRVVVLKLILNTDDGFGLLVGQEHVVWQAVVAHVKDQIPEQLRMQVPELLHVLVHDLGSLGQQDQLRLSLDLLD